MGISKRRSQMKTIQVNEVLDARGLSCPMPIVKTKKQINDMNPGEVLEVQATDQGSKADIKAWAESVGHQYLGTIEEGDLIRHYVRKASVENTETPKHSNIVDNDTLMQKLSQPGVIVLDVREEAEYAFGHIPGAISLPLGQLENRAKEFVNTSDEIYVVCRTGNRSDFAAQKLTKLGYTKVYNVVPGMSKWTGETIGL